MHSLPNDKRRMGSDRFVKLSEADVKSFSEEQENVKTKKRTLYDLKLFKEFLTTVKTKRENFKKFLPPNYSGSRKHLCWE